MRLAARDHIAAARLPASIPAQSFGLWRLERLSPDVPGFSAVAGCSDYAVLSRFTESTLHQDRGEIVMEDSPHELRKHLPIWMAASGTVLVTGLGMGCVVRGLLASPTVDHIDVVEIDPAILRVFGAEFAGNPRVRLHEGDALDLRLPGPWDFAWHDLWTDGPTHLAVLHARLILSLRDRCRAQGAWGWPRELAPLLPNSLLGTRRRTRPPTCLTGLGRA